MKNSAGQPGRVLAGQRALQVGELSLAADEAAAGDALGHSTSMAADARERVRGRASKVRGRGA